MSEREAEPADVRPFLPRPGEPVEDYAERLRAMHRDLSVVLQAVERGLQRAHPPEEEPEALAPPAPEIADLRPEPDEVRVASASREPSATALRDGPIPGAPRVEVVTTRSGHRADDDSVDTPWAEGDFVERRAPIEVSEDRDDPRWERPMPPPPIAERPSADPLGVVPPRAQPALAERPSADPRYAEQPRAEWAAAPLPPAPPAPAAAAPEPSKRNIELPPWIVTAVLAGWLTVIALLFAVVLGQ